MKRISVLLAEDHMVVREGLRWILEQDGEIDVVGEAQDGRQAVAMALRLRPAVVLMDIAMPQLNGLEATRQLLKALPASKVLILSAHSEEAYVVNATSSGAVGFLYKQSSANEVAEAIKEVARGGTFFSQALTRCAAGANRSGAAREDRKQVRTVQLSSREMEVLQLVAEGKGNKQTAAQLGIGIKTVEKHREHVMKKLGIHDIAGLTRYAIGAGIIESGVQLTIV